MSSLRAVALVLVLLGFATGAQGQWLALGPAKFTFLFKTLTEASLQVPAGQPADDWLQRDYPRRLDISYNVAVSAERFTELFLDNLADNYGPQLAGYKAPLTLFANSFESVEKGDSYQLEWSQGVLSLRLNQRLLYSSTEPGLAAMVFSVWLGEAPISRGQRKLLYSLWRDYQEQLNG